MEQQNIAWHSIQSKSALALLKTDIKKGLAQKDAEARQKQFGQNSIATESRVSALKLFFSQLKSPLIFILLLASGVTFLLKEYTDSAVIFIAVLINSVLGYLEEYKANQALSRLKQILKHKAVVIREGKTREILREELVPGDIIELKEGDKVPADARILEATDLRISEAILTGEWIAAQKESGALSLETPLADRDNMAYMGTLVEHGKGIALVIATGKKSEMGNIGKLLEETKEEPTPYQKQLIRFSWVMTAIVVALSIFLFAEGIIFQKDPLEMFKTAVAVAVSAIPEGLPITMTIILAVGMQRILKRRGLVRRLSAAETLGGATLIATDKTLTLTEGNMRVEHVMPMKSPDRELMLMAAALANESFLEYSKENAILRGRPTDKALAQGAMEQGFLKHALEEKLPLLLRVPFSSQTKYIASFHKDEKKTRLFVTGSPERVIELSRMSPKEKNQAETALAKLAQQGLRVIGVGTKTISSVGNAHHHMVADISFLGLISLKDPLRKGTKEAILLAKQAGLKTIIVTGDHILTAKAIAKELGLATEPRNIMEGKELAALSEEELQKRLGDITIFARVEPAHKLRVVTALQDRGEVVAMTGDGVNDAPALKKADIGVALESGTDVAKENADLVLLQDDFSIIPEAIREGRVIMDNIRKTVTYLVSGTFTEVILVGTAILLGLPLPLAPLQILWINIMEDALPSMALAAEKPEKDAMLQKPNKKGVPLLTRDMKILIFAVSAVADIALLALFLYLLKTPYELAHIQTIMFAGLGVTAFLYAFSIKSLRKNIWQYNPFSNLWLVGAVGLGSLLMIAAVYNPWLNRILGTAPLTMTDWTLLCALGVFNIAIVEFTKWRFHSKQRQ
ncbi:MAG: HAD-IC family P-type ATPase [Candidatus Wildermuthbacteria bacterium]|nr:HAD-IC family P-type ATPase [Candidatus Wildermuthbacteria bacterium]